MAKVASKVFFYFSLSFEAAGKLSDALPYPFTPPLNSATSSPLNPPSSILPSPPPSPPHSTLIAAHRTATLHKDYSGQTTLTNLVLRNYVLRSRFDQADAFQRKTSFPEDHASNNQHARFLYYLGWLPLPVSPTF
jgi:hypothetical protein